MQKTRKHTKHINNANNNSEERLGSNGTNHIYFAFAAECFHILLRHKVVREYVPIVDAQGEGGVFIFVSSCHGGLHLGTVVTSDVEEGGQGCCKESTSFSGGQGTKARKWRLDD